MLNLMPLTLNEAQRFRSSITESLDQVLLHGGYPRIYDQGLAPAGKPTWWSSSPARRLSVT